MIFNLSTTAFDVYFDGDLTGLSAFYRLRLVSNYANDEILNSANTGDGEQINLTNPQINPRYSKFSGDFTNLDITTFDIEGYYTWIVENGPDQANGPWTLIKTGLCKVYNASTQAYPNKTVQYLSDDETNTPYIYYK